MIFDVLTLFPGILTSPLQESILGKAIAAKALAVRTHNIRGWAEGKHLTADDTPYGGGDGMVMKPEPIAGAVRAAKEKNPKARVVMLTPQGKVFRQADAVRLSREPGLILLCGRYEGFDERVRTTLVDEEISIGDYILTGGELGALILIDAIARNIPGVLGSQGSAETDSFSDGLLEYPQYTRPFEWEGQKVPEVLLSGNHAAIEKWRRQQQLIRTRQRRPDLLDQVELSEDDQKFLHQLERNDERPPQG